MITVNNKNKSDCIVCYFFHKRCDLKENCTRYIEWKKKQQNVNTAANNNFCLSAVNSDYCFVATDGYGKLVIDSCASCHIYNDGKVFFNLNRSVRKPIVLANNDTVISSREGMIIIRLKANDKKYNNITWKRFVYTNVEQQYFVCKASHRMDFQVDFYIDSVCFIKMHL